MCRKNFVSTTPEPQLFSPTMVSETSPTPEMVQIAAEPAPANAVITLEPEAAAPGTILGVENRAYRRHSQDNQSLGDVPLKTEQVGHSHYSHRAGWLRAMVLGANDGLVSTSSLMMGVSGGDADLKLMILTGLAGMVAGALSMALGEYVSVHSQKDSELADLKRERDEFLKSPAHAKAELEELVAIYINRGLRPELARQVAEEIHEKDLEEIVKVHARDELGIDTEDLSRPIQAAWTSALAFCIGAAIPLLAGSFIQDYIKRLISIIVVASATLFAFGALGAVLGGAPWLRAAIRVMVGGWLAMGATFGVGKIFGVTAA